MTAGPVPRLMVLVVVVAVSGCGGQPTVSDGAGSTTPMATAISPTPLPSDDAPRSASVAAGSSGIARTEAPLVQPLAPASVEAVVVGDGAVRVSWSPTGEDVASYMCFRRPSGGGRWESVGSVAPLAGQMVYECTDTTDRHGQEFVYGVAAVNVFGASSETTESGPVTG